MRVVAALGGNALLRRGQRADVETQRANVATAVAALAPIAAEHELVVTHGNGPQVGLLALQSEAYDRVPAYPLDVLGAESEGMVGYLLEQEFGNRLPGRATATLLTQVVVDPADPAFAAPSKPIGPVYVEAKARRLAVERGWDVAPDGDGWRRVVPSPEPQRIVEVPAVRILLAAGTLVVCVGGGGVPVVSRAGRLSGVEAVVDKDLSAALLAESLQADALLLLTDAPGIQEVWGAASATTLRDVGPDDLARLRLPAGSMGPKAEAALRFAATGGQATIGALVDAGAMLAGTAGTRVHAGTAYASSSSPLSSA
jgi:carbamate kinase